MRAFLSTGAGHHPVDGSRYVCGLNVDSAVSEARAILAETEPETRHSSTFAPVPYYRPQSSRSERGMMHAALAESLAAFIEQEF